MTRKPRKKSKAQSVIVRFVRPTEHREAHNDFRSAGAAVRIVPVIETLLTTGRLTQREYDALAHYREQAHRAEDDMAQESTLSPARVMGGGGSSHGRLPAGVLLATPAIIETARLERELGSLFRLARAVAVDDITLTRWCVEQAGGIEKRRQGKVVAIEPRNPKAVNLAAVELRFAARRIMA
jgi:hypothetical protein